METALQTHLQDPFQPYLGLVFPLTSKYHLSGEPWHPYKCAQLGFLDTLALWDVPKPYGVLGKACSVQETSQTQG